MNQEISQVRAQRSERRAGVYFCEPWMMFAKLRGWLARWTALSGGADAGLRRGFWVLPDGAFVGKPCGGVQPVGLAIFCDDAVDGAAIRPGVSESLTEGWLGESCCQVSLVGGERP